MDSIKGSKNNKVQDKSVDHTDEIAKKQAFPCQHCPRVCKTKAAFSIHKKIHDPSECSLEGGNIGKQCDVCKKVFYHSATATANVQHLFHIRKCKGGKHRNRPKTCKKCGNSFAYPYLCKRHEIKCRPVCTQCGQQFKTHMGLGVHLCPKSQFLKDISAKPESEAIDEDIESEAIDEDIPSVDIVIKDEPESDLENETEGDVDPIKIEPNDDYLDDPSCDRIPLAIDYGYDLEDKQPSDKGAGIPCQYCSKVCKNKAAFTMHIRIHNPSDSRDEGGKECHLCNKVFNFTARATARRRLLSHLQKCKGGKHRNRPRTCTKCGKYFAHPYLCKRHAIKCSPLCPLCGQQFRTHMGLKVHNCRPTDNPLSSPLQGLLQFDSHLSENKQ